MSSKPFMAVDADELKKELQEHQDFIVNAYGGFSNLPLKEKARVDEITQCIARVINLMPVEAVEVVHAKWQLVHNGKGCCSNCNILDRIDYLAPYCRYCGAVMDLRDNL